MQKFSEMQTKKIIMVIIDGLGDKPIPELGNKTPLEAAKTPNLDFLAKNGICGQVLPFQFSWQKYPESDTCHLALFGYPPAEYYLGRGPYEAAGAEMELKEGDIALRANFATIDQDFKIIDRRAGRIDKTQPLIKALKNITVSRVKFLIKNSFGHRAVLILRGKGLSEKIRTNDPKERGRKPLEILAEEKTKEAEFTAKVLEEFLAKAHQILEVHPENKKRKKQSQLAANYLLVRGAGKMRKTPSFFERYQLKACCIAGGSLYKGIGKILGMDLIKVKGANGLINTNLKRKFQAVETAVKKYDFIFLHIKAADNLAEDGNFLGKKEFIERIDKNMKPMLKLKNTLIVVSGDHSTCCNLKRHCSEPIPILIFGNRHNGVERFSEKDCQNGRLGKIKQLDVIKKVFSLGRIVPPHAAPSKKKKKS